MVFIIILIYLINRSSGNFPMQSNKPQRHQHTPPFETDLDLYTSSILDCLLWNCQPRDSDDSEDCVESFGLKSRKGQQSQSRLPLA